MSNYFCINKSGKKIPVYSDADKKSQIGTIYNREAFGYDNNWGGDGYFCNIVFRKANGSISGGYIIDPPNNAMLECTDYPYGKARINGTEYKTFLMRKTSTVYKVNGSKWGTVAANRRVACKTVLSGDSHPEWKAINYVENTNGLWIPVNSSDKLKYGFVDTGLSVASGYSSIPMYGSW